MADNYTYDVFLVSATQDKDFAEMVTRRLRALKMKVWYDKDRGNRDEPLTFTSGDARKAEKSRAMLVLWSQDADKSDWVHAAARTGRATTRDWNADGKYQGMLIQTAIDDVIPRDPFQEDERYSLEGLTARKNTDGYGLVAGALGLSQGRDGLSEWITYGNKNEAEKNAWLAKYGADPLAQAAAARKAASEPYLSEMRKRESEWAAWTLLGAAGLPAGVPDDLSLVGGISDATAENLKGHGIETLGDLATLPDDRLSDLEGSLNLRKEQILREEWVEQARELLEGLPPRAKTDLALWTKFKDAAMSAAPIAAGAGALTAAAAAGTMEQQAAYAAPEPVYAGPVYAEAYAAPPASGDHIKVGIITAILSAIALMFFFGWLFGKDERQGILAASENTCPAGQYPVDRPTLTDM